MAPNLYNGTAAAFRNSFYHLQNLRLYS